MSSSRLKPTLSSLSTRTDTFLRHASRLLQTPNGLENTLATIIFTSTLAHSQLTRLLERRYETLAFSLATKAAQSLGHEPGSMMVASLDISPPPSRLSRMCVGVKALTATTAEVWMFLRLCGLFRIYRWAHETYSSVHRDAVIQTLLWGQIAAAATFQVIENLAFLASKGILNSPKWEQRWPRWMAVSNRFWMVQVVLEGLRLLRVRQLGWNEELGAEEVGERRDDSGVGKDIGEIIREVHVRSTSLKRQWQRDFYANAGWLPLTLHWSYEDEAESPVTEVWQGICGLVPSVYGLLDAWRHTA